MLNANLTKVLEKLNVQGFERHFLLCVGESCAQAGVGDDVWNYLKKRLTELKLTPERVYRTKVGCLRICQGGPIGLVYPEGIWYENLSIENIERVIQEHLIKGAVVKDLVIAQNPLNSSD